MAATGGDITDLATGASLATCEILANTSHIAWSPDARWIGATNTAGKIAVCDPATGARAHVLAMSHEGPGAVFSRDGRWLLAGDWKGSLFAWDTEGFRARTLALGEVMVIAIGVLPNDRVVLLVSRPEPVFVIVMDARLETEIRRFELPNRTQYLAAGADDRRVAIAGFDWFAQLDLETGAVGDRQALESIHAVACTPGGRTVVISTEDGYEFVRDGERRRHPMQYAYAPAVYSSDGRRVGLATWGRGEVWDTEVLFRTLGFSTA